MKIAALLSVFLAAGLISAAPVHPGWLCLYPDKHTIAFVAYNPQDKTGIQPVPPTGASKGVPLPPPVSGTKTHEPGPKLTGKLPPSQQKRDDVPPPPKDPKPKDPKHTGEPLPLHEKRGEVPPPPPKDPKPEGPKPTDEPLPPHEKRDVPPPAAPLKNHKPEGPKPTNEACAAS